jgi:hypothetical protein
MPQEVETVSGAGHGTSFHVSTRRGIRVEELLIMTEVIVDLGTSHLHCGA